MKKGLHPYKHHVYQIYSTGSSVQTETTLPISRLISDLDLSNHGIWAKSRTFTYDGFGGRARNFKRKFRLKK